MANFFKNLVKDSDYQTVDHQNRFNYLLQTMMSNRWKITLIVLSTFFFIVFGIVMAVLFKATIQESWKEMLLILLGAFVGNLNKVIDFYFSSEDRDKMLIQKMDEEDGNTMSNVNS
jgi:antibiotic biosynthesis monooxygenase (ABM) superfamily enzyme